MRFLGLILLLVTAPAFAEVPRLSKVGLSSAGLATLEFTVSAEGPAAITLPVPPGLIDDVLKSLSIDDPAGRAISVSLPAPVTSADHARRLGLPEDALGRFDTLVRAMTGRAVQITRPRALSGRIVGVDDPEPGREGAKPLLSLLTDQGLTQVPLGEVEGLQLQDPADAAVFAAMIAARASAPGRTVLAIALNDGPRRDVRLTVVIPAAVWKVSYRLTPVAGQDQARLQAWAVLENTSGWAWQQVHLALSSGTPVAYRQALSRVVGVDRPEVPPAVVGRPTPSIDRGTLAAARTAAAGPLLLPAPQAAARSFAPAAPEPPPAPMQEVGEAVSFPIPDPVSLATNQTLLLPLIDRVIPAVRVLTLDPAVGLGAVAALEATNDSGATLPGGLASLTDPSRADGFLGDVRLATWPAGERRLLAYAVDQRVSVDRRIGEQQRIGATLAGSVLRTTTTLVRTTTWRIAAPPGFPLTRLVVGHTLAPGFAVTSPMDGLATPTGQRFTREIAAGGTEIVITDERPVVAETSIASLPRPRLIAALTEIGTRDPRLQPILARLGTLADVAARAERVVAAFEAERQAITDEQVRLRETLAGVPPGSDLARRFLASIAAEEDKRAPLAARLATARSAAEAAEAALSQYVASIRLD